MKGHLEVKLPLTTSFQRLYCVLASDASDAEPCFNCYADEDTATVRSPAVPRRRLFTNFGIRLLYYERPQYTHARVRDCSSIST